jgi:4-hydroxymandelate oxidase
MFGSVAPMSSTISPNLSARPKLSSIPATITCVDDYERLAPEFVDVPTFAYISGGSGHEFTLRANSAAFDSISLVNRILVDCTSGTTATRLLNQTLRHPIVLAPVAFQRLVHSAGELATVQAARALDTVMVSSTLSSVSLEDVAQEYQDTCWFQLYFQPDCNSTLDLIQRAEQAGYRALVVTLDASIQATNRRAKKHSFVFPDGVSAVNLQHYPKPPQVSLTPDQSVIFQGMMSEAPSWEDMVWLLKNTSLPVLVKGVLHPADAQQLIDIGVSGIVVSNHGGRALDGVPASIHSLPAIRKLLGDQIPILVDGGIRSGYDVFKCLALGANAVMIGRPQLYALAVAGALGVAHMLRLLRDELELCMALTGCPTVADISQECLLAVPGTTAFWEC